MSDFAQNFAQPPKEFWPFVRWWWPGLAVEHDQLSKELELLSEAGIGGVEVQPFLIGGSGGAKSEDCHRMAPNPFYYETLLHLLKEAKKREMKV